MYNIEFIKDWIYQNFDSILGGVIASFIVILLQTSVKTVTYVLSYYLTFQFKLIRLLSFQNKEPIYIVSGDITQDNKETPALLMGPDATAASLILRTVEQIYPKSRVKHIYSNSNHNSFLDDNIITVGGPVFNSVSKIVFEHLDNDVYFDENDNLSIYGNLYVKDEKEYVDYGIICSISNPFRPSKRIILVAGCGSHGVLAAAFLISYNIKFPRLRKKLIKELGYKILLKKTNYISVVRAKILGNDVSDVEIVYSKIIK